MICARPSCGVEFAANGVQASRGWGYHTKRCAVQTRLDRGWKPCDTLSPEARTDSRRKGGVAKGHASRRRRRHAVAQRLSALVPPRMLASLEPEYRALMLALLYMAYDAGQVAIMKQDSASRLAALASEMRI